jgi:flagellar protein FliO/FliZ
MAGTLFRTLAALAIVLLVLWACARVLRRSTTASAGGVLEVLGRQQLTKTASVAVVRVADRAYVLGVTDGRVELVAESDLATLRAAANAPHERRTRLAALPDLPDQSDQSDLPGLPEELRAPRRGDALAGSALSLTTWRTGLSELRERSVRRA